jgi:hypothetical protein
MLLYLLALRKQIGTERETDRHADEQTDRWVNGWMDRQTDI